MQVDREDAVGARGGDQVGDELSGYGRARTRFAILTGVAEIGDDRGDALCRGAAQRVGDDQQFHQIVVGGEVCRLDDENILAADIFMDFDEHFLVGKAAHAGVGQRQFQIVRDRAGKGEVAVAGDQFHGVRGPFAADRIARPLASGGR